MNIPESPYPRIVIIGGGFAGIKLARGLDAKRFQIVLIDRNNYHNFQPLMYQVASSGLEPDSIAYPLRKVFHGKPNFYFRLAEAISIDPATKTLQTSIGPLVFDHLVVASGARSFYFGMQDVERFSRPMKTLPEAIDLRSFILANLEKASSLTDPVAQERLMNFVIVGAGPTGVELAGALAELKRHVLVRDYPDLNLEKMKVHLVEAADRVLATMSPEASQAALLALQQLGIEVWLNTHLKSYDGAVATTDRAKFETSVLIWAAGVRAAPIPGLEAALTPSGRLETDDCHRVKAYTGIYALGDVAEIHSQQLPRGHPMLGAVAAQQGQHLARSLNGLARGDALIPFTYRDKGTMATIGRNRAVVDLSFFKFSGYLAWLAWMFVHLMLLVGFRSRIIVFINWAWSYINYDKSTRLIIGKPRDQFSLQPTAKN